MSEKPVDPILAADASLAGRERAEQQAAPASGSGLDVLGDAADLAGSGLLNGAFQLIGRGVSAVGEGMAEVATIISGGAGAAAQGIAGAASETATLVASAVETASSAAGETVSLAGAAAEAAGNAAGAIVDGAGSALDGL